MNTTVGGAEKKKQYPRLTQNRSDHHVMSALCVRYDSDADMYHISDQLLSNFLLVASFAATISRCTMTSTTSPMNS